MATCNECEVCATANECLSTILPPGVVDKITGYISSVTIQCTPEKKTKRPRPLTTREEIKMWCDGELEWMRMSKITRQLFDIGNQQEVFGE